MFKLNSYPIPKFNVQQLMINYTANYTIINVYLYCSQFKEFLKRFLQTQLRQPH